MNSSRKQSDQRCSHSTHGPTHSTPGAALHQALAWLTSGHSFTNLALHGNVSWSAMSLVSLAILWVWSDQRTLTGSFSQALGLARQLPGKPAVTTYAGLLGALQKYTAQLLPQLESHLHRLMQQTAGPHWRIGKWVPLAVDGSRVSTPRTQSNEASFAIKDYGSGARTKSKTRWKNKRRRSKKLGQPVRPQIWLTLIWHMGLKMPWCWTTGPAASAERDHFQQMLKSRTFPEHTLFCGDAGFVGYDFWKAILEEGHSFLIRVGGNVRLLRKLGVARTNRGVVHLWPDAVQRKKQPPLKLRLLEFQGARGQVYLVTNLLSERALSARQAQRLYRLRWGVELQFRTLKQTFGRSKLRSRTAENAVLELDWSLMGLWLIQLYAVQAQLQVDSPPERTSVALALDIFQEAMRSWSELGGSSQDLCHQLASATKDSYHRKTSKRARYRPASKDKPSATKPILITATRKQQQAYRELQRAA